jgi:ribonuclease E
MSKSMLVNVTAEEENRVAIVENGVLDIFEIETLSRENLKGNIFKAIVEGVNPALEAAFVNYGGERAAFLPLDEVNFKFYPSRNGGAGGKGRGARITRHLEKGMEVLVQVIRDSFGNKPPTLSTYYSLPGRYLVLMPGADAAGISRKIEDEEHRDRLRRILDGLTIPEGFGVIVRTAGMEVSPTELQADLDALLELWRNIEKAGQNARAPSLVYQERDLVLRTIRDYFTSDIEEVLIDDEAAYHRARKFFEAHMPDKAGLVKLYTGDKPIFSKHNLEDQIERIYKRVVQLKSGGSISIDQTEALTAIDVNSARSVRSANSEDTAARTNLEAADEIARQLRLRDIGGLIVIDFIDMESSKHIRQVERAFADAMSRDKARYDVTRISKLGLMEVSRQRIKATKASSSFMECPTCGGDGTVRTPEAAARAAFRKIQARIARGDVADVKVYLPPEAGIYLLNQKRDDLARLEARQKARVEVVLEARMKPHQFEIEEVRRETAEAAPIVTADTVDQALADGTLVPAVRPPEAPEAHPTVAAEAADAGAQKRGRRRRRRRRGHGPETATPAAGSAGGGEALHAASPGMTPPARVGSGALAESEAAGDEEAPVFSEGPEADRAPAIATRETADSGAGASLPRLADLPVAGAAPAGQHRRRRRRRRHRGRGGRDARQESTPGMPQYSGRPAPQDSSGPRFHAPQEAGNGSTDERPSGRPAWVQTPAPAVQPPAPPASAADSDRGAGTAAGSGEPGPAAGDDGKPRRRWWRRALRG